MRRVVVSALIFALGSTAAFAEDTIAQAGARALQSQLAASAPTARFAASSSSVPALHARMLQPPVAKAMQQDVPVLSKSGMSGRKKAILYISLAAAFVGSAWIIDHNVQDITPSSLGTRQD